MMPASNLVGVRLSDLILRDSFCLELYKPVKHLQSFLRRLSELTVKHAVCVSTAADVCNNALFSNVGSRIYSIWIYKPNIWVDRHDTMEGSGFFQTLLLFFFCCCVPATY